MSERHRAQMSQRRRVSQIIEQKSIYSSYVLKFISSEVWRSQWNTRMKTSSAGFLEDTSWTSDSENVRRVRRAYFKSIWMFQGLFSQSDRDLMNPGNHTHSLNSFFYARGLNYTVWTCFIQNICWPTDSIKLLVNFETQYLYLFCVPSAVCDLWTKTLPNQLLAPFVCSVFM